MITPTDRRVSFRVQASDDQSKQALKNLTFELGAALFNKVLGELEYAGFKPDLEQVYNTNPFEILNGTEQITAWAPRAVSEKEDKAMASALLKVDLTGKEQRLSFTLLQTVSSSSQGDNVQDQSHTFLLSIDEKEKQRWTETFAALKYDKGPEFLKAIVDALKKQEFKVEIDDLWRSDSSLMQGEISVKIDGGKAASTVTITLPEPPPQTGWTFRLKEAD